MKLDENLFKNYHCNQFRFQDEEDGIETISIAELKNAIAQMEHNARLNNKDISEVPVFIGDGENIWCIRGTSFGWGNTGMACEINSRLTGDHSDKLYYVAPDSRPDEGEYWMSRGANEEQISGFVVSKLAGERLSRMVKLILENDNPYSYLDYRESEPNWIQFKFKNAEFDIKMLGRLASENKNIITLDILKSCKL